MAACVLACWPATQAVGATAHHHRRARPLILAQSGVMMRLPAFRLDGRRHEYTITIHPIQVTDERSAAAGWRLIAAISQFSSTGGGSFRAAAVIRPHCGWAGGTQWAAVVPGPLQHLGGRPAWLCAAAPAPSTAASTVAATTGDDGGTASRLFAVSATLTVTIPAYVAAGRYSAIMTFTLLAKPGI
jgi:WxL domain surface cell wall-binding